MESIVEETEVEMEAERADVEVPEEGVRKEGWMLDGSDLNDEGTTGLWRWER